MEAEVICNSLGAEGAFIIAGNNVLIVRPKPGNQFMSENEFEAGSHPDANPDSKETLVSEV
jgi:hypothetical protein